MTWALAIAAIVAFVFLNWYFLWPNLGTAEIEVVRWMDRTGKLHWGYVLKESETRLYVLVQRPDGKLEWVGRDKIVI